MTQRQQFLQRHLFALVAAASVLAATSIFYISQVSQKNGEDMEANNFRKLLSLDQYLDPKTVKKAPLHLAPTPKTLTVVRFDPEFRKPPHHFSIFTTGTLERYGTGRVKYEHVTNREVNHVLQAPCLAVLTHLRDRPDLTTTMNIAEQRRLRQCKIMVTADEFCDRTDVDVRAFYTKDAEELAYLPLGPRDDTWKSYNNVAAESPSKMIEIIPASQRKHKINGIFSNTSRNREVLSSVLDSHPDENEELNAFLQISKQWHYRWNTDEYVKVLLDSTFTLSPIGRNPECFRLFEAVEAGSIPIVVLDEDYYTHPCNEALDPWINAPIVFLNSWDDLYHWVNHHLENPVALDRQQAELREWYDNHMRTTVSKFELFMLDELDTMS